MTDGLDNPNQAPDALWYPSALPPDVERFVDRWGQRFSSPAELPRGTWGRRRRRVPGRCYDAAGAWYTEEDVSYVEGIAAGFEREVPHAWRVTAAGEVIELAREEPAESYRGVIVPERLVGRAHVAPGIYGPVLPFLMRELGWELGG